MELSTVVFWGLRVSDDCEEIDNDGQECPSYKPPVPCSLGIPARANHLPSQNHQYIAPTSLVKPPLPAGAASKEHRQLLYQRPEP